MFVIHLYAMWEQKPFMVYFATAQLKSFNATSTAVVNYTLLRWHVAISRGF